MSKPINYRYGPNHFRKDGYLSVWASIVPLSRFPEDYLMPNYGDEDLPWCTFSQEFKFGYFDHDFVETCAHKPRGKPVREHVKFMSWSSSFIDSVIAAAKRKGIRTTQWVVVIYRFAYNSRVTRVTRTKYMQFLGAFEYDKNADAVELWTGENH